MYVAFVDFGGLIKVWKVDIGKEVWLFECLDIEVYNIVYWYYLVCWFCLDKKIKKKLYYKIIICIIESKL